MEVNIISCSKSFHDGWKEVKTDSAFIFVLISNSSLSACENYGSVYLLSVLLGFCCEWQIPIIERHEEFKLLI